MLVKARSMAYFRCIAYSSRHHNCTDNDCNNKFHHSQKQFPKVNKQVQFRSESFGEINFHVGRRRYFFLFIRFFLCVFLGDFFSPSQIDWKRPEMFHFQNRRNFRIEQNGLDWTRRQNASKFPHICLSFWTEFVKMSLTILYPQFRLGKIEGFFRDFWKKLVLNSFGFFKDFWGIYEEFLRDFWSIYDYRI